ncbi:MAG: TetR/AcrR family transcriptional regulator [Burkholderiales bacterium]
MARRAAIRAPSRPPAGERKEKLIAATGRLLRSRGLACVTTRDIAREAKVAEGALYHHFGDKAELILEVALHGVGNFREVLESLRLQVGLHTVEYNLERVLQSAFDFHYKSAPMFCSLFADQELLRRVRRIMNERCLGPGREASVLAAYLRAEQRLGRVSADTQTGTAAKMMLAMSFNAAMHDNFYGTDGDDAKARRRIRKTVQALLVGLAPGAPPHYPEKKARR